MYVYIQYVYILRVIEGVNYNNSIYLMSSGPAVEKVEGVSKLLTASVYKMFVFILFCVYLNWEDSS